MHPEALEEEVEQVRGLLETRLKVRGHDLRQQIARAGRLLPRRVQRDGAELAAARERMQIPKLAVMTDVETARARHERVMRYLESVDPKDRLKGRILGLLGSLSVNFILFVTLLLILLSWRGFL